jgi:hypothetical protein
MKKIKRKYLNVFIQNFYPGLHWNVLPAMAKTGSAQIEMFFSK